ncbi:MAG TPA: hypothetical protein DCQ26_13125 [Marinilabiliales bacterium]|nr:MAG: hypothetical protein A2W84_10370 [Bacteroidetes bacterium GWC2_40_13]OFX72005.1 MAG: hypothetical protein A2W96_08220 [Bacteroidetes bacterium GWD2_40_43]OFX89610.1 MAG: hypothetical protein A2W97_12800 [Bacteroidetes bacterium GWE2_40_63]OFY24129.1 MAG: hypothetical protein A2W88_14235 [Bacteroidetes bacterium GWF2_40_13]OFZ26321.1 MAG: hypothetical protein A2437_03150 [Bacteroidetes bacterium RIFOXYC2_FULL_40_12]HAM99544.1 hypothetical protein [Marinilabiliales bacterium]
MSKILTSFFVLLFAVSTQAQVFEFGITDPNPLPDPLAFCYGDSVTFTLEYDGWGFSSWYKCTEEPDFVNWSNSEKWEMVGMSINTFKLGIEGDAFFWVNVTEGWNTVTSQVFHLQLKGQIPTINYSDTLFCEGTSLVLSVTPGDLGDGNYQWFHNTALVENQTSESLEIADSGTYQVIALTNPTQCSGIYYPSQPTGFHYIKPDVTGTFKPDLNRLVLQTSLEYTSYQWYQASSTIVEMEAIDGQTTNKYNATITDFDKYYALSVITSGGCHTTSDKILVNDSIYSLPEITVPSQQFLCRNQSVTLELKNQAYASYQWYKNGSQIWNETKPTLLVNSDYQFGTGNYTVKVTTVADPNTVFESEPITLEFNTQPYISIKNNDKPCPDGKVVLQVTKGANGEVGGYDSYQWYFNDINNFDEAIEIANATDSVFEINVPGEARHYWVSCSFNSCDDISGSKIIEPFKLYPPNISMDPYEGLLCLGDTINLSIYSEDVSFQWYLNGVAIEGADQKDYQATEAGNYDVLISSLLCETTAPVKSEYPAVVSYRVSPSFGVEPEGHQYGQNPNHLIFCKYDTVHLNLNNAGNYKNIQWVGKLFDPSSSTDDWEEIEGQTSATYTFINGVENDKLHYKVRVDSMMEGDKVCTGISEYKTIDGWIFQSPAIASYNNSELCENGDSTLIHLAFQGTWSRMEWYCDGILEPNSNTDSIYAKKEGEWTITCYPEYCPNIPHSSGVGPYVKIMQDAEILENDTVIYAMPELGFYSYQWYFNNNPIDMDTIEIPWVLYKNELKPGSYTVEVSNPAECLRLSAPYVVVGVDQTRNIGINIFPNPVETDLHIELNHPENVKSIEIYDATGKLWVYASVIDKNNIFSLDNKKKGIFLIKVNYMDKFSDTFKVIKN